VIRSVRIRNYKSLRDVTIEPGSLTVFVGANGSGKTSVLEAIRDWAMYNAGSAEKVFSGNRHPDSLYTRGGNGTLLIRCDLTSTGCILEGTPPDGYPSPPDEITKRSWSFIAVQHGPLTTSSIAEARDIAFFRLNAASLAAPSYSERTPPRMESTGDGLASVLASMALSEPDQFDDLVKTARSLISRLRRLRFRKAPVFTTEKEVVRFGNDAVERAVSRT
jgi:predicted ATPase